MTPKQKARLVNTIVAGTATLVLLVFLLSYSETGAPPTLNTEATTNKLPQYYLHKVKTIEYDEAGRPDIKFSGETVKHDPVQNNTQIDSPEFLLFENGIHNWTVSSQSGVMHGQGEQVDLEQKVLIESTDGETILKTPQLAVFPQKKLAKTGKPVTLQNPNGFTRSIGLNADLGKKRIDLLNEVRGQYQGVLVEDEH